MKTPIETLKARLSGFKKTGNGGSAQCPAHDDRKASLSVTERDDGTVLLKCHAGCDTQTILSAIGLTWADLFSANAGPTPSRNGRPKPSRRTFPTADEAVAELEHRHGKRSAVWTYHDSNGNPVGLVVRWDRPEGKDIRPVSRHVDGWRISAMPEPRSLYRLPDLAAARRVVVTEGEKAADAAQSMGFMATTSAGGSQAAKKTDWRPLAGKEVWILPDNDPPGRKYAETVAELCQAAGAAEIRILDLAGSAPALPLGGDLADVLSDPTWCGLPLVTDAEPTALAALLEQLGLAVKPWQGRSPKDSGNREEAAEKQPRVAEQLVRLAMADYRFGRTEGDELFAVAHTGPNLALMLKGRSNALRATLARRYRQVTGRTPGASALTDALNVVAGEALAAPPEPVHLRVATREDGVVIDLGNLTGQVVMVRPGTWEVMDRSPVLFRRSALTAAMPTPERGGTLAELRELLNVTDESWPLVLCWLVAAYLPEIPHAVLLLSGLQGTGKSCAARIPVSLVDPSPAPLRSEPRDLEQWQIGASGSWVIALDNLSSIPTWLSDALCRASTGEGLVKRMLFTDGDLTVLAFRRVVLLTSIDADALRGDLGDRLLWVDLKPIADDVRRTEREIRALFAKRQARILGALLDALVAIIAKLPNVHPGRFPRIADFARVLAAADATGVAAGALDLFREQQGRIAAEIIDGDPFALDLVEFVGARAKWQGTATELLAALLPDAGARLPQGWPRPNGVGGRLKRLTPALVAAGVIVDVPAHRTKRGRIIKLESRRVGSSLSSPSSPAHENTSSNGDDGVTMVPDLSSSAASREYRGTRLGDDGDDLLPELSNSDGRAEGESGGCEQCLGHRARHEEHTGQYDQ
jgi:hypothetical protein